MSSLKSGIIEKPLHIPFGDKTINAILSQKVDDNDQGPMGGVILTHGAGGDMNNQQLTQLANHLAENAIACARFTCKALNLKYRIKVYKAVLEHFIKQEQWTWFIIGGRSMGARAAISTANESQFEAGKQMVKGVVCLSYPLHPPNNVSKLRNDILRDAELPVLFISGTMDAQCERTLMEDTLQTMSDVKMHWLDKGDHGLNVKGQDKALTIAEICQVVSEWCKTTVHLKAPSDKLKAEESADSFATQGSSNSGNVPKKANQKRGSASRWQQDSNKKRRKEFKN